MAKDDQLQARITELEEQLKSKESEVRLLRQQLMHVNERIEAVVAHLGQELKLATAIQKKLSPTDIPNLSGIEFSTKYVPGTRMGGDYFDIFELEDKMKFGMLVASSSGYSMSALFLSVLIKLSGQIEARKGMEPNKVIELIAAELCDQLQSKDQASLFYAIIDRRTFEMRYCSVGQIYALWFPMGSDKPSWLEASGSALKKDFNETPLTDVISMGPRDRLILVTEGLVSAKADGAQEYGRERLLDSLLQAPKTGVHEVRNEILFQLEKYLGRPEVEKDVTVLVTEVKDKVIKLAKKSMS